VGDNVRIKPQISWVFTGLDFSAPPWPRYRATIAGPHFRGILVGRWSIVSIGERGASQRSALGSLVGVMNAPRNPVSGVVFSGGVDTLDLKEAKARLDELAGMSLIPGGAR
jgi:hypothetical protein